MMDGLAATAALQEMSDPPRVIVLTTFDLDDFVFRALQAGAAGFLLKDTPPLELIAAVRVVAAGEAMLSPGVTRRLIHQFTHENRAGRRAEARARLDGLTGREREVLVEVARGLSNQEIGERLHLGYGTVKTHVSHLLTKLDCRDRAQLVMVAYEAGIARPGGAEVGDTVTPAPRTDV